MRKDIDGKYEKLISSLVAGKTGLGTKLSQDEYQSP